MKRLVYVLPIHNEEKILAAHVDRLTAYLERFAGARVLLVENGSVDGSWRIAQELAQRTSPSPDAVSLSALQEASAGIGYAYHRGLVEAIATTDDLAGTWAVLTAADLPFGFSDLEAALISMDRSSSRILMGSKAHADSTVAASPKRRMMSSIYRVARRAIVGMRVGDSQGSVFLRLDLARDLLPKIASRNFFYSTELCYFAEQAGESIVELPVVMDESEGAKRASTVRPFRDGTTMAKQLWQLRRRGE